LKRLGVSAALSKLFPGATPARRWQARPVATGGKRQAERLVAPLRLFSPVYAPFRLHPQQRQDIACWPFDLPPE
jgi:hypothetical protein